MNFFKRFKNLEAEFQAEVTSLVEFKEAYFGPKDIYIFMVEINDKEILKCNELKKKYNIKQRIITSDYTTITDFLINSKEIIKFCWVIKKGG